MADFEQLREEFPIFQYQDYKVEIREAVCYAAFRFGIPGLCDFEASWEFPVRIPEVDEALLNRLCFQLGMVETISYYKCVCPKVVEVCCGELSEEQKLWWRKLYYNGLGEFLYRNGIQVTEEELVEIRCVPGKSGTKPHAFSQDSRQPAHDTHSYRGCLVPVGGGKDSVVSLELLRGEEITTYSVNGNETTRNVIEVCDYKAGDYAVKRVLDAGLLELNKKGYLNGHIPFSAVVAFSAVIAAYLNGSKYIVLSNETSANETTVKDSTVNHQYSKSFEFERDFTEYLKSVTDSDIHYFSFLRPLTELQIAWLFAGCEAYHKVFRSCNAGSKQGIWCCNCPKCLFVYIILTPFLSEEALLAIFGEKLLDKPSLEKEFRELTGIEENKPFECVGTRKEVLASLKDFVERGGRSLLTDKYREVILAQPDRVQDMLREWAEENQVPERFQQILKERSVRRVSSRS